MRLTRVIILSFAALVQTGCQSAGNLIQAPIDMMGRMFQAVGRTFNMVSNDHGASPPATIDDREAKDAAAIVAAPVKPPSPGTAIVQR